LVPAESVDMKDCSWLVWFKRTDWKDVKPSKGLVSVSANTDEAKWMPLR
jgi:hypothetical protein